MLTLLNNRFLSSVYTLIVLLSVNWFLPVFGHLLSQTSLQSRLELAGYVGVMIALELVALRLVGKYYRGWGQRHAFSFCVAVILFINLLGLLLSFTDAYLVQSRPFKAIQAIALMIAFVYLCRIVVKRPVIIGALSILYAGMITVQAASLISVDKPARQSVAPGDFKQVTFRSTPNIYILSFDAMVSPESAAEYLDLQALDYVRAMEERGARLLRNTFSDGSSTKPSLNATLYLDPAIWRENLENSNRAFSGISPSPVFEIFRNNGYDIATYYAGIYRLHGPYVDEYTTREAAQSYCTFALEWFYFQHLGYCQFREKVLAKLLPGTGGRAQVFDQQIIDRFVERARSGQSWLSYIYTYAPGHTNLDYSHSDREHERYKAGYKSSQKQTTDYLQSMLDAIIANDPTGIVYVFGDHGAWMSRGVDLTPGTAEFVIRDRHSVFSALYPGDACQAYIGHRSGEAYITPGLVIRQLITCLAGGDDPLDRPADYSGPYEGYGFERFVYE